MAANITNDFYPSKFLRAADLNGKEVVATIDRVEPADFEDNGVKVKKPVIHFRNAGLKPLVCNKTNGKLLSIACESPDYTTWGGKQVVLYPHLVEMKGDVIEAVRVKRVPVPIAEELNEAIPF
jgi:hypothetical protein